MASIKGTKTEVNILTAFAGESQARNRYTYAAGQAKKEGFEQISAIFEETANHEKEHAKRLFKLLEGGDVEITGAFPAGTIGSTLDNLKAAAAGEHHENTYMYPDFAKIAREEGLEGPARVFDSIAVAETFHEKRFLKFAEQVESGTVFHKETAVVWKCRNCGYTHEGTDAPQVCPACAHPQAHFEVICGK